VWSLVATTSLNLAIISLPHCHTLSDTIIIMFIPDLRRSVCFLYQPNALLASLAIIDPCPCGFASDFMHHPSFLLPSSGCQWLPYTEACSCLQVLALMVGMSPTLKFEKGVHAYPRVAEIKEVVHLTVLCFLITPLPS
jgi:hypothetical protein